MDECFTAMAEMTEFSFESATVPAINSSEYSGSYSVFLFVYENRTATHVIPEQQAYVKFWVWFGAEICV